MFILTRGLYLESKYPGLNRSGLHRSSFAPGSVYLGGENAEISLLDNSSDRMKSASDSESDKGSVLVLPNRYSFFLGSQNRSIFSWAVMSAHNYYGQRTKLLSTLLCDSMSPGEALELFPVLACRHEKSLLGVNGITLQSPSSKNNLFG